MAECPAAKELFDKASAILGYDLLQVGGGGGWRSLQASPARHGRLQQKAALAGAQHSVTEPPTTRAPAPQVCVEGPKEKLDTTAVSQVRGDRSGVTGVAALLL